MGFILFLKISSAVGAWNNFLSSISPPSDFTWTEYALKKRVVWMQFHYIFIRSSPGQNTLKKPYSVNVLRDSLIQVSVYLANIRSKSGSAITYPSHFQYLQRNVKVQNKNDSYSTPTLQLQKYCVGWKNDHSLNCALS